MSQSKKRSVCDFEDDVDLRAALLGSSADNGSLPTHNADTMEWVLSSSDPETTYPQSMNEEVARLQELKSYAILDTDKEVQFDRLTRLASRLFDTKIALVSLVDFDAIMCKYDVMIVPDASKDFRFQANPLVTGPPDIRFYAGAPLVSPEGFKLGTFCIIDSVARPSGLSEEEAVSLKDLASTAVQLLVDRRQRLETVCPETLIAVTAHDLITPLTAIQFSISMLKDSEHNLSAQASDLVDTAMVSVKLMTAICKTTFDTMRESKLDDSAEDGTLSALDNVVHLSELVQSIRTIVGPIQKKVPFVISLDPSLPQTIIADDLSVFRSCLNLLINAIERTLKGSVRLLINKTSVDGGEYVAFECCDNGPSGSTESKFPDGLEPFVTHVKHLKGTYGHYSKTEGSLTCCVFWFKIRLRVPDGATTTPRADCVVDESFVHQPAISADEPISATASAPSNQVSVEQLSADEAQEKAPLIRPRRALVVDDSKVIRKCVGRAMSNQGFVVSYACDGLEGLRQLKSNLFDVTLIDFLMPNLDGVECVRQYRTWELENRSNFRQFIIGISAHADVKDQNLGLGAGMDWFRSKPITVANLKEVEGDERLIVATELIDNLEQEKAVSSNSCVDGSGDTALVISNVSDQNTTNLVKLLQAKRWTVTVVSKRSSCFTALQSRCWDLVMIDDNLGDDGLALVSTFREWEKQNRVNRQRHVFLACNSPIPSPCDTNSAVQPPLGFNGVLPKPLSWADLNFLLRKNQQTSVGDVAVRFKG